jgi:hypothetical protein
MLDCGKWCGATATRTKVRNIAVVKPVFSIAISGIAKGANINPVCTTIGCVLQCGAIKLKLAFPKYF